jgi:hypothetical protein
MPAKKPQLDAQIYQEIALVGAYSGEDVQLLQYSVDQQRFVRFFQCRKSRYRIKYIVFKYKKSKHKYL